MENGDPTQAGGVDSRNHGSASQSQVKKARADTHDNGNQGSHRRVGSGGIMGTLSLLRSSTKHDAPRPLTGGPEKHLQDPEEAVEERSKRSSSFATALRQQGRKRKGSLRKTAMLGTSKIMRERRNSFLKDSSVSTAPTTTATTSTTAYTTATPPDSLVADMPHMQLESPEDDGTPRHFSYEHASLNSSSDSGWHQSERLSISTDASSNHNDDERSTPRILTSPVGPYASTTDDDEGLSFFRPTTSSSTSLYNAAQLQPSMSTSSLQRRRSNRSGQHSSLTTVQTPTETALDDEWDYSETEWWGWVVLIVTWIVFVVGMGSCLGVWGWAWDVGETPYAPPELEDDPTLPITGYYPALMVCTAVMAWVWVVVAWVGMKYFRHAKVVGEDG
ncbi:hypothetical protein B0J11DRAFT_31788 [Dendryphion nanum]|uniref:Uncharacterized protein n=1 Tax=Dendryphion nanum TaxID=256645 RepID=A0A9P9EJT4_9PLEO|nr:hypothetical protein B0J11DRAFT_31788 [Dendryphion nanum]